jgi:hypothetical protein
MITEAILTVFLAIPKFIISVLPTVSVELPENVFDGLKGILNVVGYLIPIAALIPIIIVSFGMDCFKVVMALVVRIKSFIPGMGD